MKNVKADHFICTGVDNLKLSKKAVSLGSSIFSKKEYMLAAARYNQEEERSSFIRFPIGYPAELQDFGLEYYWNGIYMIPKDYPFSDMEKFCVFLENHNNSEETKNLILECIEQASSITKQSVLLNVEGPFSTLASLIEPTFLYRNIIENKNLADIILNHITEDLVSYVVSAIEKGISVLSFADPMGDMELVGMRMYQSFSGKYTVKFLKMIEQYLGNTVVHLCGKTSLSLEKAGFMSSEKIHLNYSKSYEQSILDCVGKDIHFIGYGCINCERIIVRNLWQMKFTPCPTFK